MNIGIYNPYLDTLGGHERYTLGIAQYLSHVHSVTVFWDDPAIRTKARDRFGFPLEKIRIQPNVWNKSRLFEKSRISRSFDIMVFVSDGSIPLSFSKRTVVLFEFPVPWVRLSAIVRFKVRRISAFICNSSFTKKYIDKTFHISSLVAQPGIDTKTLQKHQNKKTKTILSVGRFTRGMNTKKQSEMIDAFIGLYESGISDWSYHLVGGVLPHDEGYLKTLKARANGYPIYFHSNISRDTLIALYKSAGIYWHATGFGEDLDLHPERAEHFGMSTIEAMAAGAVPVVFAGGGQVDIISDGSNGFLWKDIDTLKNKTSYLIKYPHKRDEVAKNAVIRSNDFEEEKSWERLSRLIIGKSV